jgi:hypothetical protein
MKNIALTCCLVFVLLSCKKNNETNAAGNVVVHGYITLSVSVMHHTWPVSNISVFLKKDAVAYPGPDTTLYQWRRVSDASGMAVFTELFPGKYFLYAKGYDSVFGDDVIGYMPIELNSSTAANNEAYCTIMVSE